MTGESRPYNNVTGGFKRVRAGSQKGAWEWVVRYESGYARYSDIALDNTDAKSVDLGVNCYYGENFRAGLHLTSAVSDINDDDAQAIRLRAQFVF